MSQSKTVFGSEFQMVGAVQRNARFAIVFLVNGRHSAGVADRRRRLWTYYVLEQAMGTTKYFTTLYIYNSRSLFHFRLKTYLFHEPNSRTLASPATGHWGTCPSTYNN